MQCCGFASISYALKTSSTNCSNDPNSIPWSIGLPVSFCVSKRSGIGHGAGKAVSRSIVGRLESRHEGEDLQLSPLRQGERTDRRFNFALSRFFSFLEFSLSPARVPAFAALAFVVSLIQHTRVASAVKRT